MSIQRYQPFPYDRWMRTDLGNFVAYADHVAAVAEATHRDSSGFATCVSHDELLRREVAAADAERARIRQAVEALESGFLLCVERAAVLSIIDGEES